MAKTSQRSPNRSWQSKLQRSRWVSPIALMLAWEAASRIGLIPTRTLAAPSQVLGTLWGMIVSGELPANLAVSLGRAAAGLVIGVSLGIVLALIAGLTREGEAAVDSPVQMLRTLPALALSPLFIVWFGIGETPKIALIAFATLFPVYLNLYNGIRGVDVRLIDAGYGISGLSIERPGLHEAFVRIVGQHGDVAKEQAA